MNKLTNNDIHFCISRLPKDVVSLMKDHGLLLAGGFIRETISGGKVKDIDLFGPDKAVLKTATLELAVSRKGSRMFETDNAFTVLSPPRLPVQFITRWLAGEQGFYEEYIALFDFTVCQAGIWWSDGAQKWESACHDDFYADLAAKRLVYTFPQREEEAGGSIIRMKKFIKRGYDIQVWSMAAVISRLIRNVEFREENWKNEKWVTTVLTGLLREVDPLSVVDGVELNDEAQGVEIQPTAPRFIPGVPDTSPDFS